MDVKGEVLLQLFNKTMGPKRF